MSKVLVVCEAVVEMCNGKYYNNGLDVMVEKYKRIGAELVCLNYGIEKSEVTHNEITGEHVKFVICEKINTLKKYVLKTSYNKKVVEEQVKNVDACIVHIPSSLGEWTIKYARKYKKPCLVTVVGCVWDSLWNHSWKGKMLAPFRFYSMRRSVMQAQYVLYVTSSFLQRRYPSRGKTIACSDVDLACSSDDILARRLVHVAEKTGMCKLVTLGTTNSPYKGQKYVIQALGRLARKGIFFEYHIVGGGDASVLKRVAEKENINHLVFFHGNMKHDCVFDFLDTMDVYIQPSKTEGLPRAVIEAMGRGMPVLGSEVGGIPELLSRSYLFRKGCVEEICRLLTDLYEGRLDLEKMAKENFTCAKAYTKQQLESKRVPFYENFASGIGSLQD